MLRLRSYKPKEHTSWLSVGHRLIETYRGLGSAVRTRRSKVIQVEGNKEHSLGEIIGRPCRPAVMHTAPKKPVDPDCWASVQNCLSDKQRPMEPGDLDRLLAYLPVCQVPTRGKWKVSWALKWEYPIHSG